MSDEKTATATGIESWVLTGPRPPVTYRFDFGYEEQTSILLVSKEDYDRDVQAALEMLDASWCCDKWCFGDGGEHDDDCEWVRLNRWSGGGE